MNDNCLICGGLIKLTTRAYPDFDVRPGVFQLIATCEDCGRSSTYDCVKPNPIFKPSEPERAQDFINRRLSPVQEPDNVIEFTDPTRIDIAPERILKRLSNLKIDQIVAVGFLQDGSEFFASSTADGGATLWHLHRAQYKLMVEADLEEGE